MKQWILTVFKRIGDLVVKLISVKTIPAVVTTYIAVDQKDWASVGAMLIAWALVIGYRYAEKVAGLVKKE